MLAEREFPLKGGALHDIENTLEIEFSSEIIDGERYISTHFHKNFEVIAVEKGICTILMTECSYEVKAGEAIFILPFYIHSVTLEPGSRARRMTFGENIGLTFVLSFTKTVPSTPVFAPTPKTLEYYFDIMEREFGNDPVRFVRVDPPFRRIMAKSMIYILGSEFISSVDFYPESESKNSQSHIEEMIRYINNNYKDDISLSSMAKEFGYNPQYLSRKLNNTFNINFKKLLNQHRMNYAYRLILDTDMQYSEIAFESGFQSIRSFNQICIDTYGKTPKQLRADYLGKTKTW